MTTKTVEELTTEINASVNLLSATYDSRLLALILLAQASYLYRGLRILKVLDEEELTRIFESAIEIVMNDKGPRPVLVSTDGDDAGKMH